MSSWRTSVCLPMNVLLNNCTPSCTVCTTFSWTHSQSFARSSSKTFVNEEKKFVVALSFPPRCCLFWLQTPGSMYQFVSCDQSTNLDFNFYHRTLNSTHRNVNIARFGTRVKSAFNPMNRQLLASNSNVTHPLATASTRSINLLSAKCGCANTTPLFFQESKISQSVVKCLFRCLRISWRNK